LGDIRDIGTLSNSVIRNMDIPTIPEDFRGRVNGQTHKKKVKLNMVSVKKMVMMIMGIFMTTSLLYALQDSSSDNFDEADWSKITDTNDSSLFYALHEREGRYFNPWMPLSENGIFKLLKWRLSNKPAYKADEESFLPRVNDLTADYINSNNNFITWLGHSSVLMKLSGRVILLDPVFGDIPFSKRRTPSALTYEEASRISGEVYVLLTHNHYDHFDTTSIKHMPPNTKFILPKGLQFSIKNIKTTGVREVDWWDTLNLDDISIVFLPSQHWSKRGFIDTNKSLWGSYLINTGKKKIFICGDTGYSGIYKEIAAKYPGIDYAFMSVGASQPRWFMYYSHQNETETIRGFSDLGAKTMIPIHWGSFTLGDEPAGYPAIHIKNKFPEAMILDSGEIIKL
jgi:N-acyl-phosphatidylethanolamine-hydrolysing phospholipase D